MSAIMENEDNLNRETFAKMSEVVKWTKEREDNADIIKGNLIHVRIHCFQLLF
jgi:hypothetical protein